MWSFHVVVQWAGLEYGIAMDLRQLMQRHPEFEHLRENQRIRQFSRLAVAWRNIIPAAIQNEQEKEWLIAFINRATALSADRDALVHGDITLHDGENFAEEYLKPDPKLKLSVMNFGEKPFQWKITRRNLNPGYIEGIARKIARLRAELINYDLDLKPWLPEPPPE
jgi:hypothetical protein